MPKAPPISAQPAPAVPPRRSFLRLKGRHWLLVEVGIPNLRLLYQRHATLPSASIIHARGLRQSAQFQQQFS